MGPAADPLLRLHEVYKAFGGLVAVNRLTLDVAPKSLTALIGPNGAGKTTVFNLISALVRWGGGRMYLEGEDITGLQPRSITRKGLARTFQIPRVYPRMTVMENLLVVGSRAKRLLAEQVLERAGLAEMRNEYAGNLSYGQQKLLDISRALMLDPRLILLDEPVAGASRAEQDRLFALIHELRDAGMTFLIIEHQMDVVREHADKVIVMNFGVKIAEGTFMEIRRDPRVLDAYFGS